MTLSCGFPSLARVDVGARLLTSMRTGKEEFKQHTGEINITKSFEVFVWCKGCSRDFSYENEKAINLQVLPYYVAMTFKCFVFRF